jgi:hypothetical protein
MMKTRLSADAVDAASRNRQAKSADMDRMSVPMNERTASSDRPKTLIMINLGGDRGRSRPETGFSRALDAVPRAGPWYPA